MQFMYMKLNNKDSHGSLLKGSEKGIVVINKKMASTTTTPCIETKGTTVKESEEEVVLLWQKQIHENYVINHMKGGGAK